MVRCHPTRYYYYYHSLRVLLLMYIGMYKITYMQCTNNAPTCNFQRKYLVFYLLSAIIIYFYLWLARWCVERWFSRFFFHRWEGVSLRWSTEILDERRGQFRNERLNSFLLENSHFPQLKMCGREIAHLYLLLTNGLSHITKRDIRIKKHYEP